MEKNQHPIFGLNYRSKLSILFVLPLIVSSLGKYILEIIKEWQENDKLSLSIKNQMKLLISLLLLK